MYYIFIDYREQQRAQKVFKAQLPLDLPGARNKLTGFGVQLLDGIDPNPDNMVCAGIIHTQTHQVGCLLRLEPNKQAQVNIVCSRNSLLSCNCCYTNVCRIFLSDVPFDHSFEQRGSNTGNL